MTRDKIYLIIITISIITQLITYNHMIDIYKYIPIFLSTTDQITFETAMVKYKYYADTDAVDNSDSLGMAINEIGCKKYNNRVACLGYCSAYLDFITKKDLSECKDYWSIIESNLKDNSYEHSNQR